MNKRIGLKIIKELAKENVKPLNFKPTDPNKIVEIYTDAMRARGMPPIKMTLKEYIKMWNQETEESVRELIKYLQKMKELKKELKKHRSNDRITFSFAYS